MSNKLRIGVSADLLNSDGSAQIKEVDLHQLQSDHRVRVSRLPAVGVGDLNADHIGDIDAAILMLERVGEHTFHQQQNLLLMARYGVGYDTIDISACNRHGVMIATAPQAVRRPVATTVIALMLALTLQLKAKDRIARQGRQGWASKTAYNGVGLVGRTLGIIGLGSIGAEVVRLARPFDMKCIAYDPCPNESLADSLNVTLTDIDSVFAQSDVLSINCFLNDATRHLVNRQKLSLMKPGAYLINTARGAVVDEAALAQALTDGVIAGAGLDVFEQEPPAPDNPLLSMEQVLLSPHALCFTDQCLADLGATDINACLSLLEGKLPDHIVNPSVVDHPGYQAKRQAIDTLVFN